MHERWDTQLIRAESTTWAWKSACCKNQINASYIPVNQDANKVVNEGAVSIPQESGNMTVVLPNSCVDVGPYNVWGTVRICHLWVAVPDAGHCAGQPGDSGGPVVSYGGFGPLAIGQVVGRNGCNWILFHSIGDMINKNPYGISGGLHLNTTSDGGD